MKPLAQNVQPEPPGSETPSAEYSPQQRIDLLLEFQKQMLEHLHNIEARTNRTTLTVSTGLVAIPGIILGQVSSLDWAMRGSFSGFLLIIGFITVWLLILERNHVNWLRRAIVRTQQALGAVSYTHLTLPTKRIV